MQQLIRPPFPEWFDNSARSDIVRCETLYYYRILRSLRRKSAGNLHLIAGGAVASGLEAVRRAFYIDGKSLDESLYEGIVYALATYGAFRAEPNTSKARNYKDPEHVVRALVWYFDHYNPTIDHLQPYDTANPFEFTFAIPIDVLHPETGRPILFVGRQDMIARYQGDCYGDDEKTTKSLGDSWAPSWNLDSQFTGYTWAMQESGIPAKGVIVRGISMLSERHGFEESVQLRNAYTIHRWMDQLKKDLERAKSAWSRGEYDQILDHKTCGLYGGCEYSFLCAKENPEAYITANYEEVLWDPTKRRELIHNLSFNSAE